MLMYINLVPIYAALALRNQTHPLTTKLYLAADVFAFGRNKNFKNNHRSECLKCYKKCSQKFLML